VPKNIALTDPEKTLVRVAPLNRLYLSIFRPVILVLSWFGNMGVRAFGVEPRDELTTAHTADELAVMLATAHEEGAIEDFAADLLTGVLDFGGLTAGDVMVPRGSITYIDRRTTVAEAERAVIESGHSRLPVVGRDLDDVEGFIHSKDLLTRPPSAADEPVPPSLLRRMLVVPGNRSLEDLLLTMRRTRVHFALVTAAGGPGPDGIDHTVGVVTLEDLLEELVGDILDESDRERSVRHPVRGPREGGVPQHQQPHQQQWPRQEQQ
jgi:CBS domain containing-hemolysin-like protein